MKRDMVGYGQNLPQIRWPNKARIAINFVVNYEEGAELSPINGDDAAEVYGGEFPLTPKPRGMRNLSMESVFEYGSRVGIWRLLNLFDKEQIDVTFFATGFALTLNDSLCQYLSQANHEIAGHGWRWIDYATLTKEEEKEHIKKCIDTIRTLTNHTIQGWYTGRRSPNTRDLIIGTGQFLYDSDSYSDDRPYFENQHLVIPYTLDCNDFRFTTNPGFSSGNDFFTYLKNTFTYLYQENRQAMMTIGLHPRISGHPGRAMALKQFIDFIKPIQDVWIARRIDIAKHWLQKSTLV